MINAIRIHNTNNKYFSTIFCFLLRASGFMIDPSFSCGLPKEDQTPYIFNSFTGNNISTMQGNLKNC